MSDQYSQFLTDVVTAAGLIAHGKQDKKFAERLSTEAIELRAVLAQEAGKCEPVAYADPKSFENFKNLAHLGGLYAHEWMWANPAPGLAPLYTSPPAPVSVVLPDVAHDKAYRNGLMQGYNLALNGSEQEYQDTVSRYSKHEE